MSKFSHEEYPRTQKPLQNWKLEISFSLLSKPQLNEMSIQSSAYVFEPLFPFQKKLFILGRVRLKKKKKTNPNMPVRSFSPSLFLARLWNSQGNSWLWLGSLLPLVPVECGQQKHGKGTGSWWSTHQTMLTLRIWCFPCGSSTPRATGLSASQHWLQGGDFLSWGRDEEMCS